MAYFLSCLVFAVYLQLAASCCGPVKMQGYEGVSSGTMMNGKGIASEGSLLFTLDGESNKMSIIGNYTNNGQPGSMHLLYDFKMGKLYSVYDGVCMVDDLDTSGVSTINCLPSNAKLVQSTYFGYGSEKFEVNTYEYTLNGNKYVESRTKNTCIPISGHMDVANGFSDYGFTGWTDSIKDTSVLDVPKECRPAAQRSGVACCGPLKMQGYQGVSSGLMLNGVGISAKGYSLISIDGERNMLSIIGNSTNNGQPISIHMLYDVPNRKMYNVYNGACQVEDLVVADNWKVNCIPDDAKLIESTFYGFGSEKFDVSMYEYAMNGMQYVEIRTKNTCIPVSGHNKGKNGFNDWGFSGLQEGIKDASVFDIPRECRHTSPKMNPSTMKVHVDPNNII